MVKKEGVIVGEVVLHEFDFYGGLEIGFRIAIKEQKKGYAFNSVTAVINFIKEKIKPTKIKAKCYKENVASENLLTKLGFTKSGKDEKYYYFYL